MKSLIVDDDSVCRKLLRSILAPLGVCDEARDGKQTMEQWRQARSQGSPYQLLCLDIMLPGADGRDILSALRGDLGHASDQLKVLVISSLDPQDAAYKDLTGIADGVLAKPVNREALIEKLRAMGLV